MLQLRLCKSSNNVFWSCSLIIIHFFAFWLFLTTYHAIAPQPKTCPEIWRSVWAVTIQCKFLASITSCLEFLYSLVNMRIAQIFGVSLQNLQLWSLAQPKLDNAINYFQVFMPRNNSIIKTFRVTKKVVKIYKYRLIQNIMAWISQAPVSASKSLKPLSRLQQGSRKIETRRWHGSHDQLAISFQSHNLILLTEIPEAVLCIHIRSEPYYDHAFLLLQATNVCVQMMSPKPVDSVWNANKTITYNQYKMHKNQVECLSIWRQIDKPTSRHVPWRDLQNSRLDHTKFRRQHIISWNNEFKKLENLSCVQASSISKF